MIKYNYIMKNPKAKLTKEEKELRSSSMKAALDSINPFFNEQDEVPSEEAVVYSPTGRPTKYSAAIIKKTYEYLNLSRDEFYNYQKGFGATDTYERRVMANIPTLEGLALHLNVHRDTVHLWSTRYPSFSDALDILMAVQRERLIMRGLSGDYNPMITKLILSANHGMKERVDNTTDDKPIEAPVTINNYKSLSDDELIALARNGKGGAGK